MKLFLILFLTLFLAGCRSLQPQHSPALNSTYPGKGTIVILDQDSSFITLNQQAIPGLMSAMLMTYHLTPVSLGIGFHEGENVRFTLQTDPLLRSMNITSLAHSETT